MKKPVLDYLDKVQHMNDIERTSTTNEKQAYLLGNMP